MSNNANMRQQGVGFWFQDVAYSSSPRLFEVFQAFLSFSRGEAFLRLFYAQIWVLILATSNHGFGGQSLERCPVSDFSIDEL